MILAGRCLKLDAVGIRIRGQKTSMIVGRSAKRISLKKNDDHVLRDLEAGLRRTKEERVIAALQDGEILRWCEMPKSIGFTTLHAMEKKGLIEQIADGVDPYSMKARWRLRR